MYHYTSANGETWTRRFLQLKEKHLSLFTEDEAQAWLQNEPDLASDDSYHGKNPIRSYQNPDSPRVAGGVLKISALFC